MALLYIKAMADLLTKWMRRRREMSLADQIFVDMCNDIINNGVSTEGEKVRPKWEDGTSAYTIKKFGVVNHASQNSHQKLYE